MNLNFVRCLNFSLYSISFFFVQMFYDEEVVAELKQLYHDIDPEGDWDLSLSSLRQVRTALINLIADQLKWSWRILILALLYSSYLLR
jgi:hypothetical protein